uniref:RanBP2-type domain-containing protein n=1 Tax=Ascaris lumbricoides TaxID=6252 RepID=A0A9J2P5D3_ASCLU
MQIDRWHTVMFPPGDLRRLFIGIPLCLGGVELLMTSEEERKWSCQQCTYANYASANVCTMCRTPRHTVFITEPPGTSNATCASVDPNTSRWPCPSCTFMNVLQAGYCSICLTKRPQAYESELRQLTKAGESEVVDMEHIDKMNKALRKWSCTQCTYKNWPTVKMCTMCRALRTSRHDQPNDDTSGTACGWSGSPGANNADNAGIRPLSRVDSHLSEKIASWQNNESGGGGRISTGGIFEARSGTESPLMTAKTMVPLDENVSLLERYILHLQQSADTGCCAFLQVVAEVMRADSSGEDKALQYIYQYGEGNRKITSFEGALLNGLDDNGEQCLYNHTLLELLRERHRELVSTLPRFFTDSVCVDVDFPGLVNTEISANIYKSLRSKIRDDFDMRRIANVGEHFTLPIDVYNMKPWLAGGEADLRIFMDFDERQILKTICFGDTLNMDSLLGRNLYAPILLRNRGGGHSLVDAVSQAMWGVLDKNNLLRGAIYQTLYMKEAMFRSRWATSLLKMDMKFDVWVMQRYWANIMDCHEPGTPLEQIHILVLAQVLNRPIIVMPVESAKLASYMTRAPLRSVKHPMEGFYPQLPAVNSYRCCAPLFLAFSNGNFYAMILPPPSTSPALSSVDTECPPVAQIYRHARCPPIELADYVQFALDGDEADRMVRESMMFDIDENGTRWFYHSMCTIPNTASDQSSLLWSKCTLKCCFKSL